MTVNAAARRHRLGWDLVNSLVVVWAGLVGEHRRRRRCRLLLVDETSIRKRHRYVTVLADGDTGEGARHGAPPQPGSPDGVPGSAQGHRWCRGVKVVVSRRLGGGVQGGRSINGSATPATCWTGSTSSDGSRRG